MKNIEVCGQQNIALCGHRGNATRMKKNILGTANRGNFLTLLSFRVEAGDAVLGEHLTV